MSIGLYIAIYIVVWFIGCCIAARHMRKSWPSKLNAGDIMEMIAGPMLFWPVLVAFSPILLLVGIVYLCSKVVANYANLGDKP
jgi:hypothetical protein